MSQAAAAIELPKRPSSQRRIASSRANGKLSRGPITLAGKRNSSINNRKHRLNSKTLILPNESEAEFLELRTDLLAEHHPASFEQEAQVEIIALSLWMLRRAWLFQKNDLEQEMARPDPSIPAPMQVAIAFRNLGAKGTVTLALRYESKYQRQFSRALERLLILQDAPPPRKKLKMQVDPIPESEQPSNHLKSGMFRSTPLPFRDTPPSDHLSVATLFQSDVDKLDTTLLL